MYFYSNNIRTSEINVNNRICNYETYRLIIIIFESNITYEFAYKSGPAIHNTSL